MKFYKEYNKYYVKTKTQIYYLGLNDNKINILNDNKNLNELTETNFEDVYFNYVFLNSIKNKRLNYFIENYLYSNIDINELESIAIECNLLSMKNLQKKISVKILFS